MFKIIACINQSNVIGNNGNLIYKIPNDLANFARQTKGNVVIMGRKTFNSLPNGKPLAERINIILTRDTEFCVDSEFDNVFICHTIEEVQELCNALFAGKEHFVIGGGEIYKEFLEKGLVDEMRITKVNDSSDGDAVFPRFDDEDEWKTYYKSMCQTWSEGGVDRSFYYIVYKKN